jgi:hypothetical protein
VSPLQLALRNPLPSKVELLKLEALFIRVIAFRATADCIISSCHGCKAIIPLVGSMLVLNDRNRGMHTKHIGQHVVSILGELESSLLMSLHHLIKLLDKLSDPLSILLARLLVQIDESVKLRDHILVIFEYLHLLAEVLAQVVIVHFKGVKLLVCLLKALFCLHVVHERALHLFVLFLYV